MQTSGSTCLLEPNESIRLCNKSSFNSLSVMSRMAVIKLGAGTLLGRYETWRVAPLSLLVPVVGLASAALLLDERLTGLQFLGAVLIMTGLYINVFGLRWRKAVKVGS